MDYGSINRQADLLRLVGGNLKRLASSQGGEWAGPCPFCGGRDRFHVQPHHQPAPRWFCRRCTGGQWRSPLDFVMLRDGVTLHQAAARLAPSPFRGRVGEGVGSPVETVGRAGEGVAEAHDLLLPFKQPGDDAWQNSGLLLLERTIQALWCSQPGENALRWLESRGLQESTLRIFLVGWSHGMRQGGFYAPQGVVLPCLEGDRLWSLKIALLPQQMTRCQGCQRMTRARFPCPVCGAVNKYRYVRGGRPALFNLSELWPGRPALFVEGEFDCMAAWQVLRDEIAVITLGSASARFDLRRWGASLLQASQVYTLLDNDPAGEKGRQAIRQVTGGSSIDLRLPPAFKDVNDFLLAGGDLRKVVAGCKTLSRKPDACD